MEEAACLSGAFDDRDGATVGMSVAGTRDVLVSREAVRLEQHGFLFRPSAHLVPT